MGAAGDFNGGFSDFEMLGEEFNQGVVGLAVVRLGAEIDSKLVFAGRDDFFLGTAGFYGDFILWHYFSTFGITSMRAWYKSSDGKILKSRIEAVSENGMPW